MEANKSGLSEAQIRRYNSETMRLLSLYLNLASDVITPRAISEVAAGGLSNHHAYAVLLATVCGLSVEGRDRVYFENYFLPMVKELDPAPFENDPYYQAVKIGEAKEGKWELKNQVLKAGEAFVCDDLTVLPDGRMLPSLGFFMRDFHYPAILEGGREWMTLQPNETVTTQPAVEEATGRVLTLGLGLGYFAFSAAEKESVTSVTVIERSADAARLFRRFILPCIPHKEKIRVIVSDAFGFLDQEMKDGDFDFCFADIWRDAGDGLSLYHRLKEYEARFPRTRFSYWIEDTLRCYDDKTLWDLP